jgi:L-Ala-D/L-Glu epimerase
MTIRRIDLLHVDLPLRMKVKHASYNRVTSDSLIVRVTLDDGTEGYGEGVPRSYVTGETVATTFEVISAYDVASHIGAPKDYRAVVQGLATLEFPETRADPRGMFGNAARCALEMAILDAYGRRFGQSLGDAVRLADVARDLISARPTRVRYSGAITARSRGRELYSALKIWSYGFRQIKIKIGLSHQDDAARLSAIRKIVGRSMDLRLDANEAWSAGELLDRVRPIGRYHPSALEQPIPHGEVDALAELRPRLGVPVMLDESLCGYPDAVQAIERKTADLFNVRLSKCGGIFPSLRIIELAARSGVGVQLGCHPGETGILSAAGRHFASNVRGLRYVEGSYDGHILAQNVIKEDLTFGYAGFAPPLPGPGLGVEVDPPALEALTVARKEIRYD